MSFPADRTLHCLMLVVVERDPVVTLDELIIRDGIMRRRRHNTYVAIGMGLLAVVALVGLLVGHNRMMVSKKVKDSSHEPVADVAQDPVVDADEWLKERVNMRLEIASLKRQVQEQQSSTAPVAIEAQTSTTSPTAGLAARHSTNLDWLVIGIPTVPRPGERAEDAVTSLCLYRTVMSYIEQFAAMEGGLGSLCRVVVYNQRPGNHHVFARVKREVLQLHHHGYLGLAAARVVFVDNEHMYKDDNQDTNGDGQHEPPTPQVRRQSLDVVAMLDYVVKQHPSTYFLFTEDDFELCPNGLVALQYALGKARRNQEQVREATNRNRQFTALRCGIGLNGIVMHNNADVAAFRTYLRNRYTQRPPDHLVVEFFAKETPESKQYFGDGRRVAAFRHNIFRHLGGAKSTLRQESAWSTPGCFTELIEPQLFAVEAWNARDCPNDDVWPCDSPAARTEQAAPGGGVVLRWNTSSAAAVSQHWSAND